MHVLDWNGDLLALSKLPVFKTAKLLVGGAAVPVTRVKGGVVLHLPQQRDEADTVIVLER